MGQTHLRRNFRVTDILHNDGTLVEGVVPVMTEDVPTVSAGAGAIAGIGVGPQGEPGVVNTPAAKRRRKKTTMPLRRLVPPPIPPVKEAST